MFFGGWWSFTPNARTWKCEEGKQREGGVLVNRNFLIILTTRVNLGTNLIIIE